MSLLALLLSDMKIASFNVQRFGQAKIDDKDVRKTLVKVKHVVKNIGIVEAQLTIRWVISAKTLHSKRSLTIARV